MMNELLLPTQSSNPILNQNLKAFFLRYPYERSRLELLLSEPIEKREAVPITLPPVPSKPPMRVLLIAGLQNPQFLLNLLNEKAVQKETFKVFIVENNPAVLADAFQHYDLVSLINYSKTEWFFMHNVESIKPALFRILKREEVASMMRNVHILETAAPQPAEVSDFYKELPQIYDETIFHVMHNFGRISDSLDGVRATLMNEEAIMSNPGIRDLKNAFKGLPALVVGAGPSLDKHLKQIKQQNDKFVVIAADAALKPLIQAGIRVDYTTSIERLNDYQKPFFEGLGPISTELVAFPVVLPSQFKLFPGQIRLVYRNYSYFAYFEKNWPKGILKCGGSTSHLAVRLADWMGCSKIILIGIDSAYEQKEGEDSYRSHCSATGYPEWGHFLPLKELTEERKHSNPITGTSNSGKDVLTNMTYYQWAKEYAEELSEIGFRIPIVNCSADGLKIEGIPYCEFEKVAEAYDVRTLVKPEAPRVLYNRVFDHKVLLRNFECWRDLCNEAIFEAEHKLDFPRFEALVYTYNFKMVIDSLLIAFVVQCCAKEFFELENRWWALDQAWDQDLAEKTAVLRDRFILLRDVLNQLIAIFTEVKNGE